MTKFLFAQPGTSDIVCFRIVWYFLSLIFSVVYRRKLSSLTVEGEKGAEVWQRSFRSQSKCQEVWTRIESAPEMSPRELLFLMTIFIPTVILMTTKAILAVPKCLVGGDTSCASVAEWKENILCRIQGPGEGNSRQVVHVQSQVSNERFNPNFLQIWWIHGRCNSKNGWQLCNGQDETSSPVCIFFPDGGTQQWLDVPKQLCSHFNPCWIWTSRQSCWTWIVRSQLGHCKQGLRSQRESLRSLWWQGRTTPTNCL